MWSLCRAEDIHTHWSCWIPVGLDTTGRQPSGLCSKAHCSKSNLPSTLSIKSPLTLCLLSRLFLLLCLRPHLSTPVPLVCSPFNLMKCCKYKVLANIKTQPPAHTRFSVNHGPMSLKDCIQSEFLCVCICVYSWTEENEWFISVPVVVSAAASISYDYEWVRLRLRAREGDSALLSERERRRQNVNSECGIQHGRRLWRPKQQSWDVFEYYNVDLSFWPLYSAITITSRVMICPSEVTLGP